MSKYTLYILTTITVQITVESGEKQGERFHLQIAVMKDCYQDQWNVSMVTDCCWCVKKETVVLIVNVISLY